MEFFKDEKHTYEPLEKPTVDSVTSDIIGDFGRWQLKISILMSLLKLPLSWYQLNIIFMAPPQDFWCVKPKSFAMYTDTEWRKMCAPRFLEYPCLIFDPDILLSTPKISKAQIPLVECKNFVYDQSSFSRTITSDFDLVCDKHWYIHLSQCILMSGIVVGGILFGTLADKYGRKRPLMITIVIQTLGSFLAAVSPSFSFFLVNWFMMGLGLGGNSIISFVVCMEIVRGKWRTIIPVVYQLPFGLGNAVLAILAHWLRDWRKVELALASISSVYLTFWFLVPESPRWLLATGKTEKAIEVLKKIAEENKRDTRNVAKLIHSLPGIKKDQKLDIEFWDFIRHKNMRRKTSLLSMSFVELVKQDTNTFVAEYFAVGSRGDWIRLKHFSVYRLQHQGLSFFTFSQYLGLIGGNIFLNVAMSGIISIPGGVCCLLVITKAGRKLTLNVFQLFATFCFIALFVTPKDVRHEVFIFTFAGLGFAAMAGTIPALYLFSGELFPTVGRNIGVGGVTTFARAASIIAPAFVNLDVVMPGLPLLLLIGISLAQIAIILPLPETKHHPLPDTLEEAENF